MTIRGTDRIIAHDPIDKPIDKRWKRVKCIETSKSWQSAKACSEELKIPYKYLVQHLNNVTPNCHKLHFCYEEDVTKCREMQSAQIAKSNDENEKLRTENEKLRMKSDKERAEREELERKAALWDAYQKEQEAIRKAEEARQTEIAKVKARIERRKRMVERIDAEYQAAIRRIMEDEQKLAELEGSANA